jgi:RHS repeat-associated protein
MVFCSDGYKVLQVADPTGTYGFAYDNMGRLISTSTSYTFLSSPPFTSSYTYDAASNRTSLTSPDGSISTYGYDTLNRLNQVANSWAGSFRFSYDALSRRTQLTRPNGVNTNYSYDLLWHPLSVLHQAGVSTLDGASYTYDPAGNRTSKGNYLNGITSNYTYDALYELMQVTQGASTTESYSYDAVGNRLSSSGVPTYSYNVSNELTSNSLGGYTYDANGNTLTEANGNSYTWDFENWLTQAVVQGTNGGTTTFKYDPFGRRIQKSGPLGTTNYLYDGERSIQEIDQSGNVLARYTQARGIDQPLAELRSGTTGYYEPDALGTVTSLTNPAGALANTYTYDSFGKSTASSGTLTNPFQYTARELDPETGVYFYRARYFDPSVGRFLSEDPVRFRSGPNFYSYVFNGPIQWRDPNGKGVDWGGILDSYEHARNTQDWLNCFAQMGYCMKGLQYTRQSLDGMPDIAIFNNQAADVERGNPNNNVSSQRVNQCLRFDENCAKGIDACLEQIPIVPVSPPSWISDSWNWVVNKFSGSAPAQ